MLLLYIHKTNKALVCLIDLISKYNVDVHIGINITSKKVIQTSSGIHFLDERKNQGHTLPQCM